jgi:hypothetical protein
LFFNFLVGNKRFDLGGGEKGEREENERAKKGLESKK